MHGTPALHKSTDFNKSVLRRYVTELNRRNVAILDELVTDSFRALVMQGYERNVTAFPDYCVEIVDMIAEGDQVVLEWTHRGTHRGIYDGIAATGKVITGSAISIYTLVNGQIAQCRGESDQAAILQQLGLIPDTETVLSRQPTPAPSPDG